MKVILQLRGWGGGTPWEEGLGRWMESKFCSLRKAPTLHRRNAFLRGKGCKGHPISLLSPNFATGRGHAACRRRGQGLWETKQELGSILGQSPGWPDLRSSLNPGLWGFSSRKEKDAAGRIGDETRRRRKGSKGEWNDRMRAMIGPGRKWSQTLGSSQLRPLH